ncbi:MAG: TlyA family RNA methyltransferase [bacterium]
MDSNRIKSTCAGEKGGRVRLDILLVERGLASSREQSQRLIMAGKVSVAGAPAGKPGVSVDAGARLDVAEGERYVSRGGIKLEAALRGFAIPAGGRVCADIGASTGGFTDCLLQHGAAKIYAIDVGRSQLHERLRGDARVALVDHVNARHLRADSLPELPQLLVADVSFISLAVIFPALAEVSAPGAELVALIKPQFEACRRDVSRGRGVVRDPAVHARVLNDVLRAARDCRWLPLGLIPSPIAGSSGNREYLLYLRKCADAREAQQCAAIDVDAAVQKAFCDVP